MTSRVDLALKEYDAVFAELRQSITLQYTILGLGIGFLGIVFRETLVPQAEREFVRFFLLNLFVTGTSLFILFAWMGELARMRRNAIYLTHLEASLIDAVDELNVGTIRKVSPQFGFHTWALKYSRTSLLKFNYAFTFAFVALLGFCGLVMPCSYCIDKYESRPYFAAILIAVFGAYLAGIAYLFYRLLTINRWPSAQGSPTLIYTHSEAESD